MTEDQQDQNACFRLNWKGFSSCYFNVLVEDVGVTQPNLTPISY